MHLLRGWDYPMGRRLAMMRALIVSIGSSDKKGNGHGEEESLRDAVLARLIVKHAGSILKKSEVSIDSCRQSKKKTTWRTLHQRNFMVGPSRNNYKDG